MFRQTAQQLALGIHWRPEKTFATFWPAANPQLCQLLSAAANQEMAWPDHLIYLWGAEGSGRSHLLQAVCHAQGNHGKRAVYLPLADHCTPQVEALSDLETTHCVCLDDIAAVAQQPHWEEALFHLYNRIRERDAVLLVSASCAPRDVPMQLADLVSRLQSGLTYRLQPLSDDDKRSALQQCAQHSGFALSEDVVQYIMQRSARNMNDLMHLLQQLDQASLAAQRKLTIPFVKSITGW